MLQVWPEGGPKLLWTVSGIGSGYSAPVMGGGSIYITGDAGDELHIFALDFEGRLKWRGKNGRSWAGPYPGARASCSYDEGRLYHMNAHGRVACLDAQSGGEMWAVDVLERFGAKNITWGMSENLLIDGEKVIVTAGGSQGVMAALDKKTGRTIWQSEPLLYERREKGSSQAKQVADGPSYASPILFELGGRRHIVACSTRHVFGVDADSGRLLWTYPMPTRYSVLGITPVLYKDAVFTTGPDGNGGKMLRIEARDSGVEVEEVWGTDIDTCHGGLLLVGDHLYGAWYRKANGWGCVDARTGQSLYRDRSLTMGSAIWAEGRFYCLGQDGTMALVRADPKGFEVVSRFRLLEQRKSDVWAHPVILDGRLYLRYNETLYCYDIKANSSRQ